MARAKPIPDMRGEEPFAAAAAKVVRVRTAELREHSEGVLDLEQIERVHDLRVATRRLRAVIEVFKPCFPKKARKAIVRDLKRLADALGERRDRDVQVEALAEYAAGLEDGDQDGLQGLIRAVEAERPLVNQALAPLVSEEWIENLCDQLEKLVAAAEDRAREGS